MNWPITDAIEKLVTLVRPTKDTTFEGFLLILDMVIDLSEAKGTSFYAQTNSCYAFTRVVTPFATYRRSTMIRNMDFGQETGIS